MIEQGASLQVDAGDGLRLHADVRGAGVALLMLHGFTGSSTTWDDLRTRIGDRYRTIAADLPGHGRSTAPAEPRRYRLPRLADDLARLLDAAGVDRAAVLGYSLGGRVALHLALAHPDRVAALALESASAGITDAGDRARRVTDDEALADAIEREGITTFVDRWERLPLWDSQARLPAATRAALRTQRLANDPAGLANCLRGAGAGVEPPLDDRLPRLPAPTLLLAGALDEKYVALNERMQSRMPGAVLRIIPDAGHAVHLEQPAAFAGAVTAFLDGHLNSARAGQVAAAAAPR